MYDIQMRAMSEDFFRCWQSAGRHLNAQVQDGIQSWLRAHPNPPFLEHLSFRLGNQLFFVRIVDVSGKVKGPGRLRGLFMVADRTNGRACLLPMKRISRTGKWEPVHPGWGLIDARTNAPVDPVALVNDELIEMTRWELHDMAVEIVRGQLEQQGYELMSWQGNPDVDPSLWFIGESDGPEWVVVRSIGFPEKHATRPDNWEEITSQCAHTSRIGHFASVLLTSTDQDPESADRTPRPIWRGHAIEVQYNGLE